jgi:UDP-glucose 4-epimerase
MAKVVVTGGAGFIGSHIASLAASRGQDVLVIDNLLTGKLDNLENCSGNDRIEVVTADITEPEVCLNACQGAERIFHLAARISVPESIANPSAYFKTNTIGTCHMLTAALQNHCQHFVFSSTSAIYGNYSEAPATEAQTPLPRSPYAISKLDGEHLLTMYHQQNHLHTVSLRYFNVFGPRQDPNSGYAAAIPAFITRALKHQDLTIYGDGHQIRDFIFVEDVAAINLLAAEQPSSGLYNVASGKSYSILTLAERILRLTGSRSKIVFASERAGDTRFSAACTQRLTNELGYTPSNDLDSQLEKTIAYYQSHV